MNQIKAPFTEDQVKKLNDYQQGEKYHPFTCCGEYGCSRSLNNGILIATTEGWICPCGQYKQNWAHKYMTE